MTWIDTITANNGIRAVLADEAAEEIQTVNPWELPVTIVCARDPDDEEEDDLDEDDEDFDYFCDDDDDEDFDEEFDEDLEEEGLEEEEDSES